MVRPPRSLASNDYPRDLMTDAELTRAMRAGDAAALRVAYERYLPPVWRYVYRQLGGDIHAAEDVVSETFLAAIRSVSRVDPDGGPLCGWLMGIARHKLGDHWRRAGRCREKPVGDQAGEPVEACPGGGCDPAASLEAAEDAAAVLMVVDQLSDEERVALEWKYLDSLSVGEIAQRLGRTEKAVESLLYRARRSFRAFFGQWRGAAS